MINSKWDVMPLTISRLSYTHTKRASNTQRLYNEMVHITINEQAVTFPYRKFRDNSTLIFCYSFRYYNINFLVLLGSLFALPSLGSLLSIVSPSHYSWFTFIFICVAITPCIGFWCWSHIFIIIIIISSSSNKWLLEIYWCTILFGVLLDSTTIW